MLYVAILLPNRKFLHRAERNRKVRPDDTDFGIIHIERILEAMRISEILKRVKEEKSR